VIYFWLDASAVVKRHVLEDGTSNMQYFFNHVTPERMMLCMSATVGEVIFVLGRRIKDKTRFNQEKQLFEVEVSQHPQVTKVYPTNIQIDASLQFIEPYSINNADAIILQCTLDNANELRTDGHDLILVSSDGDFLKAARSEGLRTFNPATNKLGYLQTLINS
jgi:predicted nucleic acid-binding protein